MNPLRILLLAALVLVVCAEATEAKTEGNPVIVYDTNAEIKSAVISKDNRYIVSSSLDDKIHLFDVVLDKDDGESYRESKTFKPGNDIVVAQTEIGNIGLSVCYDLRFPEMYRKMHNENVQIITAPSAFTATTGKAHWETLLKTRAIENLCYLIASNQGGIHANGRETWGHSMIVDPWGEILAEVKEETGIAIAKIDIKKQTNLRKRFPVLTHRKLD